MIIELIPFRSDSEVYYTASGDVLEVSIDGVVDTFDFSGISDGKFTGFESDKFDRGILPDMPVIKAVKSQGVITVTASSPYGREPLKHEFENEGDFDIAHSSWELSKTKREVEI